MINPNPVPRSGSHDAPVPSAEAERRACAVMDQVLAICEQMVEKHNGATREPDLKLRIADIKRCAAGVTSFCLMRHLRRRDSSVYVSLDFRPGARISAGFWHEVGHLFGGGAPSMFAIDEDGFIEWYGGAPRNKVYGIAERILAKALTPLPPVPESVIRAHEIIARVLAECEKMVEAINASSDGQAHPLNISNMTHSEDGLETFWVMRCTGERAVLVSREPAASGYISISMPRESGWHKTEYVIDDEGQIKERKFVSFDNGRPEEVIGEDRLTIDYLANLALENVLNSKYPKYSV